MTLTEAYRTWFWLDSLFLLAALLALWNWLPGPGTAIAIGVMLASFTPIHDNHWMGQANLPMLAAMLWGLVLTERDRPVLGGSLLGLACMLKMSPALMVLWWLSRRRLVAVASACGAALVLSILALPLVEWGDQLRFYADVLPGFGRGEYNGLVVPVWLTGNHSISNLWAQAFETQSALPPPARLGAAFTNLAVLGLLAWRLRAQTPDPTGAALAAAAVAGSMLLIPVYTYEHHLVVLTFPLAAVATALAQGRLGRYWLLALLPAYVALAWWGTPLAVFSRETGGALGWWLQESKFLGILVVTAACAIAAVRIPTRHTA